MNPYKANARTVESLSSEVDELRRRVDELTEKPAKTKCTRTTWILRWWHVLVLGYMMLLGADYGLAWLYDIGVRLPVGHVGGLTRILGTLLGVVAHVAVLICTIGVFVEGNAAKPVFCRVQE